MTAETGRRSIRQRLAHEIRQYFGIALYFYVWFGAILLYKAAVLGGEGFHYAPYGLAVMKALILGKFALVAHAIPLGGLFARRSPLQTALGKSLVTLAVLVALTAVEEVVRGLIVGHTPGEAMAEFAGGRLLEIGATILLLWLVLVPFYLWRQVDEAMGPGQLRRLVLGVR